jgi:hypothetical protein
MDDIILALRGAAVCGVGADKELDESDLMPR